MLDASWGVTAPAPSESGDRVEVQNVRATRAAYQLIHDRIDPESEVASNVRVIKIAAEIGKRRQRRIG